MSKFHVCSLSNDNTSGLKKLPPNASLCERFLRRIHKLIIVDPDNFRRHVFFPSRNTVINEQKRHEQNPHYFIVHPCSKLGVLLDVTFCIVWLCKMVLVPLLPLLAVETLLEDYLLYVQTVLEVLAIISKFFLGYTDDKTGKVVINFKLVALRYLKTFFFFDIMCCYSFLYLVDLIIQETVTERTNYFVVIYLVYFIHMLSLYIRVNTVLNLVKDIGKMIRLKREFRWMLRFVVKTFIFLHIFSCMMYSLPRLIYHKRYTKQFWPKNSWLAKAKIHQYNTPLVTKYAESFLLTIGNFFGFAGSYDIEQLPEKICTSAVSFFGMLYTLFLLADILTKFGVVGVAESRYDKQLADLMEYMKYHNMPPVLKRRILRYCDCKFRNQYIDENEILQNLSDSLRMEVFLFSASSIIKKVNVFKYLPEPEVCTLVSFMELVTYAPGDVIIRPDTVVDKLFFISFGTITMFSKNGYELAHLEDGDVFGMCQTMLDYCQFSFVALETTEIFIIHMRVFSQLFERHPEVREVLQKEATERVLKYNHIEEMARIKTETCLQQLRKEIILEKRKRRASLNPGH